MGKRVSNVVSVNQTDPDVARDLIFLAEVLVFSRLTIEVVDIRIGFLLGDSNLQGQGLLSLGFGWRISKGWLGLVNLNNLELWGLKQGPIPISALFEVDSLRVTTDCALVHNGGHINGVESG